MADVNDAHNTVVLHGLVKWFDPTKGFGFVVPDEGGADILLHANVLRNFGQSSVADGTGITINVQSTDRGRQALSVVSIDVQDSMDDHPMATFLDGEVDLADAGPLMPARVKWFDKSKGFGFANVFASSEDVFIHIEVLRRCGLADLQAGEAIGLQAVNGSRGSMAVNVLPWDLAIEA